MKTEMNLKMNRMALGLSLSFVLIANTGFADNGHGKSMGREGNGGDICEDQIKTIDADIDSWIVKGGPELSKPQLDLSRSSQIGLTYTQYKGEMRAAIKAAHVGCVSPGDDQYPVMVGNTQKTCKNFVDDQGTSRIVCDRQLFHELDQDEQYRLIHHELAGLAGIELPNGDDSTYPISNQISAYLQDEVVKRLAIRTHGGCDGDPDLTDIARNPNGSVNTMAQYDAIKYCSDQGNRLPTAREWARYSQSHGARGISESPRDGYYEVVNGSDPQGKPDKFYFDNYGYQAPSGDLGSNWFWSSSVVPNDANGAGIFVGGSGYIANSYYRNYADGAVRCVRSR